MAHVRREIDSLLAGIRQDVLAALLGPGKWVWGAYATRAARVTYGE